MFISFHQTLPTGLFTIGGTVAISSLSLLLALCWSKISRLTLLLHWREQRISHLLTHDLLTTLRNRESFYHQGEQLLSRQASTPGDAKAALVSVCIDNLKSIKSEFGHAVVDELLLQIAHRLQACVVAECRSSDFPKSAPNVLLAKVGADEFALVVAPTAGPKAGPEIDPIETDSMIERLTQHILNSIHQSFFIQPHTIHVVARGGIAWPTHETTHKPDINQLLLQASRAANTVKSQPQSVDCYPRNSLKRYAVFHPAMEAARLSQLQLRQALAGAIERQELRVRYQPIVNLTTEQPVGFESLVRWQHPELGLLKPSAFLPLAEEMGLVVAIDRWMFQRACRQLWVWQEQQLYPSVSVNLSGSHLAQSDVVDMVRAALERYPIDPAQLTVEVTESVMVSDPHRAISTLKQLREIGLKVSLDDFGTGYCSLAYLSQFPVDVLKIDRSFVSDVGQCDAHRISIDLAQRESRAHINEAIVQSILTLADALEIQVVAEGIEYPSQCSWLRERQCAYGQGNFFAKAISHHSARMMLSGESIDVV